MEEKLEVIGGGAVCIALISLIASALLYIWTDSEIAPKLFQTSLLFIGIVWIAYAMVKSITEDSDADNYDQH